MNPHPMIVAAIGLAANLAAVFLLHADSKQNLNVKAAYMHLIGDTYDPSVGVGYWLMVIGY